MRHSPGANNEDNPREAAQKARQGTIVSDPELRAMNQAACLLSVLDAGARARVMAWLVSRYAPEIAAMAHETWEAAHPGKEGNGGT
jgi:hypothetical protein